MPTLNRAFDGHYYIRGKDFHRLEEDDDYWTWQVHDLDATITAIRDAGYEVSPFPASFPWSVQRELWRKGFIATKGLKEVRAMLMDMVWNPKVGDLAKELGVNSSVIVKEAGRRGVRVRDDGDRIPRSMAARIREQIWSNLGRAY